MSTTEPSTTGTRARCYSAGRATPCGAKAKREDETVAKDDNGVVDADDMDEKPRGCHCGNGKARQCRGRWALTRRCMLAFGRRLALPAALGEQELAAKTAKPGKARSADRDHGQAIVRPPAAVPCSHTGT